MLNLFKKFHKLTLNEAINRSRTEKGAVLVDIRPKASYKDGHVSGSINIPLEDIENAEKRIRDRDTPIYVYGSYENKPSAAVRKLKKMKYTNVTAGGYVEEHYGIMVKG